MIVCDKCKVYGKEVKVRHELILPSVDKDGDRFDETFEMSLCKECDSKYSKVCRRFFGIIKKGKKWVK